MHSGVDQLVMDHNPPAAVFARAFRQRFEIAFYNSFKTLGNSGIGSYLRVLKKGHVFSWIVLGILLYRFSSPWFSIYGLQKISFSRYGEKSPSHSPTEESHLRIGILKNDKNMSADIDRKSP